MIKARFVDNTSSIITFLGSVNTIFLSKVTERDRVLGKLCDFLSALPKEAAAINELYRRSASTDGNDITTSVRALNS